MCAAVKEDQRIEYSMMSRTYDMLIDENSVRRLNFCPWCGKRLPKGLIKKLFDVLWQEYGIGYEADLDYYTNVPDEFRTDEWWKKRNL